jgi:hypothetical protein
VAGYAAVVLGLGQRLGRDSSLVVAGATLAVAALFQPARRRIQAVVDRRFNRRRHDTAQTIAAFSARLHQQIDLDTLTAELLAVADQTMQPTQASLWLRPSGSASRTSAPRAHPERLGSRRLPEPFAQLCEPGSLGPSSLTNRAPRAVGQGPPTYPPDLPPSRHRHLGWQPSRFLTDRAEAERAFQLAEQLGSVNAAASQLGTTWPSLRKAFTRHGLGMPARNPEAVRQRAIAATRQRTGQPAAPTLDPVFAALNPDALPARERSPAELYQWVRRDEEYAILSANVVVELNSESRARQPTTRAWAIIRRADRAHRHTSDRQGRGERRQANRTTRSDRTSRSHQPEERGMVADAR